jgi:deoxyribose-phosphate aldolase
MDLTALAGDETADTIVALCTTAVRPNPADASVPSVAAVCLYPGSVPVAVAELRGTGVHVAAVAGAFPSGVGPLDARLQEIHDVVAMGADEVDIVLNRMLFLQDREADAFDELVAARDAAGTAVLKVILETGELGSLDRIGQASMMAMAAGADFIKTSTGKVAVNATPPAARCMAEAIRDFYADTGRPVGIKVAGGIRRPDQAIGYARQVEETLGADWLAPERFRIGASSLLQEVLTELAAS